jgi:hypothetical protein
LPDRIRIQVKNAALLQTWHDAESPPSNSLFNLTWRRRPACWDRDAKGVPCEEEGFLCDLFALCHHPVSDPALADQTGPAQGQVYLLAADPALGHITPAEVSACRTTFARTNKPTSTQRRPATLETGIGSRGPVVPIAIPALSLNDVYRALQV